MSYEVDNQEKVIEHGTGRTHLILISSLIGLGLLFIFSFGFIYMEKWRLEKEKDQMETFFHLCQKTGMTQDECNFEWVRRE